jgi:hypothetical protein
MAETPTPELVVETFGKDDSIVQCLAIMGEVANEQRGRSLMAPSEQ